jgi:hypothetical protein
MAGSQLKIPIRLHAYYRGFICPAQLFTDGEYFVLMVLSLQWRNDDPQKWIANTQIRIRKGR